MKTWVCLAALFLLAGCQPQDQPAETVLEGEDLSGHEITDIEGTQTQRALKRDAEGRIIEEGMLQGGTKIGTWITYHPEGNFPAKLIAYADGRYNGTYLEFNQRGHLTLRATYKNNKLHGPWSTYSFGRIEKKANYEEGQLHGQYLEYGKRTGKLQKEINYKNGVEHGTYRFYDEEGEVMLEYEYRDGEKVEGGVVE